MSSVSSAGKIEVRPAVSLRDKAYAHIQRKIVTGQLTVGSSLSEISLSKEIGISRTPVREAIGQLMAEGFLEQVPGRGTVVRRLSRVDLVELYELREALESYAVSKVAAHGLSPDAASELEKSCERLLALAKELETSGQARLNPAQMERFLSIDLHFHLLLLRSAANQRIVKVARDTRLLIQILGMRHEAHNAEQLVSIHRFHHSILDAVLAADSSLAIKMLADHLRISRQERVEEYDRWERMDRMSSADTWIDFYHIEDQP